MTSWRVMASLQTVPWWRVAATIFTNPPGVVQQRASFGSKTTLDTINRWLQLGLCNHLMAKTLVAAIPPFGTISRGEPPL